LYFIGANAHYHSAMVGRVGSSRARIGLYVLVGTALTTSVLALIAHVAAEPLLFPSLGPTIFIVFYSPLSPQAAPRNVICGQLIGIGCGYAALWVFGLQDATADIFHISGRTVGAVVLALTLTLSLMVWMNVVHAPAGATTLIVALGLIHTVPNLIALVVGVLVCVILAFWINRLVGIPVPAWKPITGDRFPVRQ